MSILNELVEGAQADFKRRRRVVSVVDLMVQVENQPKPLDVLRKLQNEHRVHFIAEIKRRSPSKGDLAPIPDVAALAKAYELAGASMISVLTEERQFKGSLQDLKNVRQAVAVPVLRKDFITDEYQILEARAFGADCVLLIATAFVDGQFGGITILQHLLEYTWSLGMRALVECHTLDEVKIARAIGAQIIGINARNLNDFSVDKQQFAGFANYLPPAIVKVAESGVESIADIKSYVDQGANAILVGEALVKSENPGQLLGEFVLSTQQQPLPITTGPSTPSGTPLTEQLGDFNNIASTTSGLNEFEIATGGSYPTTQQPLPATTTPLNAEEPFEFPAVTELESATGPFWGQFGGRFVPEALIGALEQFEYAYKSAVNDPEFVNELNYLLKTYIGRPSSLTQAKRFAQDVRQFALNSLGEQTFGNNFNLRIFLKREDLNHTGAHKINNALGQALLAKRIGKNRIIAETGAGQHGVATATVCALLGLECVIYMGEVDAQRQALNVARMQLLGAKVVRVQTGDRILKDAINEALRDWVTNVQTTHYLLGTVAGPHPFPTIVRDFQKIIGQEAKQQLRDQLSDPTILPDAVVACVGGGSNAIGIMNAFLDDVSVKLYGIEAGGRGVKTGQHATRFSEDVPGAKTVGSIGIFQGAKSYLLQDADGQTMETHSISAGLDYASIGPEHPWLREIGRVKYSSATDAEAMQAFRKLCELEGIIPAIESAHALAGAYEVGKELLQNKVQNPIMLVNLSGRGDKDVVTAGNYFGLFEDGGDQFKM
jgi:tryptophan synthase beta chain